MTKKTMKTTKAFVNAKIEDKAYIAYMERDLAQDSAQNGTKLMMRAAARGSHYADWRAKRMDDAPARLIPEGREKKVGYCIHVTYPHTWNNKKYVSEYTVSCVSTLEKLLNTSANSKECSFEIVPVMLNRNRYRGYDLVLFDKKEQAEAYLESLKKTMDDPNRNPYVAWKW